MNRSLETIMHESGVAFGTSGARGLVTQLTPNVCIAYTQAFLQMLQTKFIVTRIALGIDLRPSSPEIASICAAAFYEAGIAVEFCGSLPTPALALYAQQQNIPALMVTGSHIPFERNGLKFYRPDGEISKADEIAMLAQKVPEQLMLTVTELPAHNDVAIQQYSARYVQFFDPQLLQGLRLGVYEHSSVARDILHRILEQLGASVISLGRTDTFVPIDTEAVSVADIAQGQAWAAEHRVDGIISTDGDGDRPLISDERGCWLRGDIVGLLCARYLGIQQLAVPVSCNTAIEASGAFKRVQRTRIGSPYVIAALEALPQADGAMAGFEANGGFLLASEVILAHRSLAPLATRDAVLPALAVLAAARQANVKLSALVKDLPQRYTVSDRLANCPTHASQKFLQTLSQTPQRYTAWFEQQQPVTMDLTDGVRLSFANHEIVHFRASGNAPELRCYCEADTPERAQQLTTHLMAHLAAHLL